MNKSNNRQEIVCIVGPTAVGKSDYAVEYALKNNGEIISADSRQVYKGMDIGTGKIIEKEMRGVPHYLLDIVDPRDDFNVDKFKTLAKEKIEEIHRKGKLPIICGGTGFYIDAVIYDISYPSVTHNNELRNELGKMNATSLFNMISDLDKDYANSLNNSEKNNKQRLIRSIEIIKSIGKMPRLENKTSPYNVKWIGLDMSYEKLKDRIHIRLMKRIDMGMADEVRKLYDNGVSWEKLDSFGLEYRYISRYLRKMINKEEMLKRLELEICHYARRQMVWFKRNKDIEWITK